MRVLSLDQFWFDIRSVMVVVRYSCNDDELSCLCGYALHVSQENVSLQESSRENMDFEAHWGERERERERAEC
ncbi:hypothetical protein NC653_030313 [Populus alba x Populus x berolinensis]|uniref:Uncharacterized protein n=1 Tax=Populus alba x Populus x berolinensis TaxID=444605 RepID=A0AAD6LW19_9ROSI|nr:hypothetical protein NC653_030313 [Populus alba x Populus x berolinensis]